MKIESVSFVMSAVEAPHFQGGTPPEIAVSGRSNVGKSSLLNSLCGRRQLAMVSGTPGKTQTLNYFLVNDAFHLVDLPGYGHAKAPLDVRNRWGRMMQRYLRTRAELVACVQLVDCRHDPSREDQEMVRWLLEAGMPFCIVATKVDKIGVTKIPAALRTIAKVLELPADQPMIGYSSETGAGRNGLLAWIGAALDAGRGNA